MDKSEKEDGHVLEHEQLLIFIVDDSGLERRILGDMLRNYGYAVKEFVDGKDVLTWLKCVDDPWPDMILMDAMMTVLDGFSTCEAIKALPRGSSVPILMITARDDAAAIDRAFDCGAEDYIVKPVNDALLRRRIDMIIRARRVDEITRLMAYQDFLTGLPNRRRFEDQLKHWVDRSKTASNTLAVIFLDLDHFKEVNDRMGHAAGDQLLVEIARRFQKAIRSTDFIARLGGDEFMMILPQVNDLKTLLPIISAVFEACDHPVTIATQNIQIGVSVGISFFPRDGCESNTLMQKADQALYRSKERCGNTFTCYSDCS